MSFYRIINIYRSVWLSLPSTFLTMLLIRSLPAEATTLYVGDYSSLNYAINLANSSVGANIIDITGNITLTGGFFLPEIDPLSGSSISFVGNNYTISGNNAVEVFNVNGGTVSFSNLTITQGLAQGSNGSYSSGGGAGLGGGLFINAGSVALDNVTFSDNHAIGGTGGNGCYCYFWWHYCY